MLLVRPRGSFRQGFDVLDQGGAPVGAFLGSAWRESGRIQAGGEEWEFRRERYRRLSLAGPQGVYAAAERVSLWSGRWRLTTGGQAYELVKGGWFSRRYELLAGDAVVGELAPRGVFGSKAAVELPPQLPPAVQVFVIAVVMTLWRREQNSASGAAAGAAGASS
ncbi:MAG TPA: hypothetical protein VGP36_03780 [Mycobacteriales bacterium]|nr:hypothetical protein [Mycobacteriales bacterium]